MPVLRDVTLKVYPAEIVALVGSNGGATIRDEGVTVLLVEQTIPSSRLSGNPGRRKGELETDYAYAPSPHRPG